MNNSSNYEKAYEYKKAYDCIEEIKSNIDDSVKKIYEFLGMENTSYDKSYRHNYLKIASSLEALKEEIDCVL